MSVVVVLPYPPSANRYLRHTERGTYRTAEANQYRTKAGWLAKAAGADYVKTSTGFAGGGATVEDIDKAMVLGCAHPMGPLKLTDLVGLDTVKAIADKMYEEFKEPLYSPPPLLLRMVEAGRIGKKAGHGFYQYDAK